jgi:hypothetical protein
MKVSLHQQANQSTAVTTQRERINAAVTVRKKREAGMHLYLQNLELICVLVIRMMQQMAREGITCQISSHLWVVEVEDEDHIRDDRLTQTATLSIAHL